MCGRENDNGVLEVHSDELEKTLRRIGGNIATNWRKNCGELKKTKVANENETRM